MSIKNGLVTLKDLLYAAKVVGNSPIVRRTPLLTDFRLPTGPNCDFMMKMESLQNTGSFKIRGMVNLFHKNNSRLKEHGAVTMSAGNAGRSFASLVKRLGIDGVVVMPDSVPTSRTELIRNLGSEVVVTPIARLQHVVEQYTKEGRCFAHPFDDIDLIAGHGSIGLEILNDCPDVDVVVVSCGGGGLVSGIAAAIKLSGSKARVVAVEPSGAPCMHLSMKEGTPITLDTSKYKTIAHGLAAPYTGSICFDHAKNFVDECVLVSDEELIQTTQTLFHWGLVAETSACAAIAAVMFNHIDDLEGKKVACVVSGRNTTPEELYHHIFQCS